MRGEAISPRVLEQIRSEYREGWPTSRIAKAHRISQQTVNRFCEDIERPAPQKKMTDAERYEWLLAWR